MFRFIMIIMYLHIYNNSGIHRRRKRSISREMKRTFKRIRRGFENVFDTYRYNLIRGFGNIIKTADNIHDAMGTVISDALDDINTRLNEPKSDTVLEQEEEQVSSEDNILVNYCFGEILGPNYGIRTLLEYEEECEEGVTCEEDIDGETEDDSGADGFNLNDRGNGNI